MNSATKLMKVTSVIIMVFSIIYTIGGALCTLLGILMTAMVGSDLFADRLFDVMDRDGITPDMIAKSLQEWNEKLNLGRTLSLAELFRIFFILIIIMGAAMLVYGVFGIICSSAGMKAAGSGVAGKTFVWGIILLVCTVIRFVVKFDTDVSVLIRGIISFVLPGLYLYAAKCIKK